MSNNKRIYKKQTEASLKNHKVMLDMNDNLFVITSLDGKFHCSYDIFHQEAKFWHGRKQLSVNGEIASEKFQFWRAKSEPKAKNNFLVYSNHRDDIKTAVYELMELVRNYKSNSSLFNNSNGESVY